MKTAEEWLFSDTSKSVDQEPSRVSGIFGYISEKGFLDFIKQIQLDAWKQGCTDQVMAKELGITGTAPLPQELRTQENQEAT